MATISGSTSEKTYRIKTFLGLHESPDGDTKLKLGEAAVMRNFRITRDGNLQRRPGTRTLKGLASAYTLKVSGTAEDVISETSKSTNLIMYPTAAVEDGLIVLSGSSASVTQENASEYIGYYWRRDANHVWRLKAVTSADEDYTWSFYRVTAEPTGSCPVTGMWTGYVSGREELLAACDGKLWRLWDEDSGEYIREELGSLSTDNGVFFFGFSGIVYMLNGVEYYQWDGTTFETVHGYRPLVKISSPPEGAGEDYENINRLCGERRVWVSPDGTATEFQLPETDLASIDWVKNNATGETLDTSEYSTDLTSGKVTFATAPEVGTNTYEIAYSVSKTFREQVTAMRYAELYNSTQDTRVFIYGDGTNKTLYSNIDYDGTPRADYFPDLFEMAIGDANTPITGLIRHYSRLICFKSTSAYTISYGEITLADGNLTAAFYSAPVNRIIGNAATGQVQLVLNSPRTLFGSDVYEWKNSSSYSSNLTVDERQARRISDRVYATLADYELADCICYDDNSNQEYYICCGDRALIHNYAFDAWYEYRDFDANRLVSFHGEMYIGTSDGRFQRVAYEYLSDDGEPIDAYWESGSESFDADYMRKYAAQLWIGIKPESNSEVTVTVQTDKKSSYAEKLAASYMASFAHANFSRWSFEVNRKPHMYRLKIKAKKFVFYKLIFKTTSADTTATVLAADIQVRYTGKAK